jgi:2-oxoglutarate ferredoxin oxidoreductase subunit gamma
MDMEQATPSKAEVIIAGAGGQGVLFAGMVLAEGGRRTYEKVSYVPSYGTEKRGGHSECTVVLSHDEIASPLLDQAETIILLDGSQAPVYESRVAPGGTMIVEKAGFDYAPQRDDYRVLPVSGLEFAVKLGSAQANNLIMLGVYAELTKCVEPSILEEELDAKSAKRPELVEQNKKAFRRGLELGQALGD